MENLGQFVIHHWALWFALIVILCLILLNEWFTQAKSPKSLSPQLVVEKINHESAVVIDLREQEAFSTGHIINSIRASADDFGQPRMAKYKSKLLILVCGKGIQSQGLAAKLSAQGFINPLVLSGGIAAWQAADLPLVKGNK